MVVASFSIPRRVHPVTAWTNPHPRTSDERLFWYALMLVDGRRSVNDIARLLHLDVDQVKPVLQRFTNVGILDVDNSYVGIWAERTAMLAAMPSDEPRCWRIPNRWQALLNTISYNWWLWGQSRKRRVAHG